MSRKNRKFLRRQQEMKRLSRARRRYAKRELALQLAALSDEVAERFEALLREEDARQFDQELALVSKDFERQLAPGFIFQEDEEVDYWFDDRALQAF